ncbi:DinB family protein [Anatilimnocola sp. NA78]|uniref:DinB family protein n=1 Tax=Anatilimnocola sp. NA78 TaxID=3415683 RepID=UPI003CE4FC6A
MSTAELIEKYQAGPAQLRSAVAGITREQLLARPIAGKWSVLEVVAHLADFEPIFADRAKRIIATENPPLPSGDENLFAQHLAYHERDIEEELQLIEACRGQMVKILKTLPASAFQRTGVHSEIGPLTLERVLGYVTNHLPHHLPFILEKRRALGV